MWEKINQFGIALNECGTAGDAHGDHSGRSHSDREDKPEASDDEDSESENQTTNRGESESSGIFESGRGEKPSESSKSSGVAFGGFALS